MELKLVRKEHRLLLILKMNGIKDMAMKVSLTDSYIINCKRDLGKIILVYYYLRH